MNNLRQKFSFKTLKKVLDVLKKHLSIKVLVTVCIFCIHYLIQIFCWFHWKAVLYFQQVMGINTRMPLSHTRNYLWGILEHYPNKNRWKTSQYRKQKKFKKSQSQKDLIYKHMFKYLLIYLTELFLRPKILHYAQNLQWITSFFFPSRKYIFPNFLINS